MWGLALTVELGYGSYPKLCVCWCAYTGNKYHVSATVVHGSHLLHNAEVTPVTYVTFKMRSIHKPQENVDQETNRTGKPFFVALFSG